MKYLNLFFVIMLLTVSGCDEKDGSKDFSVRGVLIRVYNGLSRLFGDAGDGGSKTETTRLNSTPVMMTNAGRSLAAAAAPAAQMPATASNLDRGNGDHLFDGAADNRQGTDSKNEKALEALARLRGYDPAKTSSRVKDAERFV